MLEQKEGSTQQRGVDGEKIYNLGLKPIKRISYRIKLVLGGNQRNRQTLS